MDRQSVPSDVSCPACGADPKPDPSHRLSAIGYTHDDIEFDCANAACGHTWASGVPIGEAHGPLAEELFCDACEKRYGLIHRVKLLPVRGDHDRTPLELDLKCPNTNCYHFWTVTRQTDTDGVCLIGHPQITGSLDGAATTYGYEPGDFGLGTGRIRSLALDSVDPHTAAETTDDETE